jgi:hypothetical protein
MAAFYCSHSLLVSLTACRGTVQFGRSNLQGGAHWKLMMMSRFGRLVPRMVARARTIGDGGEEYSPFQLLITMGLDSWTLSFIYLWSYRSIYSDYNSKLINSDSFVDDSMCLKLILTEVFSNLDIFDNIKRIKHANCIKKDFL